MLKNRCVLVVDDDEDTRDTVESFLRTLGVFAVGAASAAEAMIAIRLVRIDALIVDLRIPDASAATLIGWLRAAGYDVPSLGLVRAGDTREHAAARDACDVHVTKPVDFARVEHWLRLLLPSRVHKIVPCRVSTVRHWGRA